MTTRRLAALALARLLAVTLAPAPPASAGTVRLDGATGRLDPGTRQVITVNRTRSWHARVTFWQRVSTGWRAVKRGRDGLIGYGGLVEGSRRRGRGATAGCISVPRAFMRSAMIRLDPDRVPLIAIGR